MLSKHLKIRLIFVKYLLLANSCIIVSGFFGEWFWFFDNAQNFLIHQLLLTGIFFFIFLSKEINWSYFSIGIFLIGFFNIFEFHTPFKLDESKYSSKTYSIISFNVLTTNNKYDKFIDYAKDIDPDFILLLEVDRQWINAIDPIKKSYPSSIEKIRSDSFGIAFLSKHPLTSTNIIFLGDSDIPSTIANLTLNNMELTVIGTHTLPPISKKYWSDRNRHLVALKQKMDELQNHGLVVAGDFNVTPWSKYGSIFSQDSAYMNIYDLLLNPSWPSNFYPFGIPIDFILYNSKIEKVSYKVGRNLGSDHLPVLLTFKLK